MTVRQTSAEAYYKLVSCGVLSRYRRMVYRKVYEHGPITEGETHKLVGGERVSVSPRFSELTRMGLVQEVGITKNTKGNTVILWDVTSRVEPLPLDKSKRSDLLNEISSIVNGPRSDLFSDPRIVEIQQLLQSRGIR